MMKRFSKIVFAFISALSLCLMSGQTVEAQNATTGIQGGNLCPDSRFVTPVLVTGIIDVDSFALVLNYPAETLTYEGFQFANALIRDSIKVENRNSSLRISWHSKTGVDVGDTTLLQLIFNTGFVDGAVSWDADSSYYYTTSGDPLNLSLTGGDITFYPAMSVEIEEVNQTCAGECEANIVVFVAGGTAPYEYLWNGAEMDVNLDNAVKKNACGGNNILKITDNNGCVLDSVFMVSELPEIMVEIESSPDTVYLQNPVVSFSFTEDQSIVEWLWDFGDETQKSIERNPVHIYPSAKSRIDNAAITDVYSVNLKVTNDKGCTKEIAFEIPVAEVKLFIPNVFTPPTDPNGYFRIAKVNDGSASGSEYIPIVLEYLRMELIVLDRWGRKVYDNSNYKNDWDGGNLPDGTYYYRLNTYGYFKDDSYTGAVTIIREK